MMSQHSLIAHFGPHDEFAPEPQSGEIVTRVDLLTFGGHLEHGIQSTLRDLETYGLQPSETGLDLLILATLVYAADTRISRETESQDSWTREIRLSVPVKDVQAWQGATSTVHRLLHFLTGDRWEIEFRPRPRTHATIIKQPPLLAPTTFNGLCLFSGGLDSLIGAIDLLESGQRPLFITHAGEGAVSHAQTQCQEALIARYSEQAVRQLRMWLTFRNWLIPGVPGDSTTRGRSFLFFALGVFAGTGFAQAFDLRAPENGLIALNVPMDTLRLGALSTRTTHPFYMARWNELLGQLGIQGTITNPYRLQTKGEMVQSCQNAQVLNQALPHSLSCSSPSKARWQGRAPEHCGHCLPCIIRRAAIERAHGRNGDPTTYTLSDLHARILDTRKAEGQQVRSMQLALSRLQRDPRLATLLIHKPGPLSDVRDEVADLAEVYRRGMDEVGTLLTGVRTRPL